MVSLSLSLSLSFSPSLSLSLSLSFILFLFSCFHFISFLLFFLVHLLSVDGCPCGNKKRQRPIREVSDRKSARNLDMQMRSVNGKVCSFVSCLFHIRAFDAFRYVPFPPETKKKQTEIIPFFLRTTRYDSAVTECLPSFFILNRTAPLFIGAVCRVADTHTHTLTQNTHTHTFKQAE